LALGLVDQDSNYGDPNAHQAGRRLTLSDRQSSTNKGG
jgi:hypothetical protein